MPLASSLEEHYHHWFTSDKAVRELAREIDHEVMFMRPKTSVIFEADLVLKSDK